MRSGFLPALNDEVIEAVTEFVTTASAPVMVSLTHWHGAAIRPAREESAFAIREPGYDCFMAASWDSPGTHARAVETVGLLWHAVVRHTRGAYVNGLEDEGDERVREAYGENYERLAALKRIYDPENFFERNQNITPGG
jgi:hypothetical protein